MATAAEDDYFAMRRHNASYNTTRALSPYDPRNWRALLSLPAPRRGAPAGAYGAEAARALAASGFLGPDDLASLQRVDRASRRAATPSLRASVRRLHSFDAFVDAAAARLLGTVCSTRACVENWARMRETVGGGGSGDGGASPSPPPPIWGVGAREDMEDAHVLGIPVGLASHNHQSPFADGPFETLGRSLRASNPTEAEYRRMRARVIEDYAVAAWGQLAVVNGQIRDALNRALLADGIQVHDRLLSTWEYPDLPRLRYLLGAIAAAAAPFHYGPRAPSAHGATSGRLVRTDA